MKVRGALGTLKCLLRCDMASSLAPRRIRRGHAALERTVEGAVEQTRDAWITFIPVSYGRRRPRCLELCPTALADWVGWKWRD